MRPTRGERIRRGWSVVLLAGTMSILAWQLAELAAPLAHLPNDFVEYWTAAKALSLRENPYSPDVLWPLQQGIGYSQPEALLMYNPPWTLSIVLAFTLFSYVEARLAWLALSFICLFASSAILWQLYGGSSRGLAAAWILTFSFLPANIALATGQLGPLILLGLSLFLLGVSTPRWWLSGLGIVLASVKPQVALLLWVVLAVWIYRERHWTLLLSTSAILAAFLILPVAMDAEIIGHYALFLRAHPPDRWVTPTLGSLLRLTFGAQSFWLQFVPLVPGLVWLLWHWRRHSRTWDWREQAPVLLLVSFTTSPYVWVHDAVILLLPVLAASVLVCGLPSKNIRAWGAAYAITLGLVWIVRLCLHPGSLWFVWFPSALLLLYALLLYSRTKKSFRPHERSCGSDRSTPEMPVL